MNVIKEGNIYEITPNIPGLISLRTSIIDNASKIVKGTTVNISVDDKIDVPYEKGEILHLEYHILDPIHRDEKYEYKSSYYADWQYRIFPKIITLLDQVIYGNEEALYDLFLKVTELPNEEKIKEPNEEDFYYDDIKAYLNIRHIMHLDGFFAIIDTPSLNITNVPNPRVRVKKVQNTGQNVLSHKFD